MVTGYDLLNHTQVLRLAGAFFAQPVALMYHRFGNSKAHGAVPLVDLERQIRYVHAKHHVLTASHFCRLVDAGEAPSDAVTLTIDDGYADVYTELFPLLQRYSLPATIYVATDFIDGRLWLWPDRLDHVLRTTTRGVVDWSMPTHSCTYSLRTPSQRVRAWSDIADDLMELAPADRDLAILELSSSLSVPLPSSPPERYRPLTWEQIREMQRFGCEIGSHTCTHPRLSQVSGEIVTRELADSKHRIEDMLQTDVRSIAYPHGGPEDVSQMVCDATHAAGYINGFASYPECAGLKNPLLRPRFPAPREFADYRAVLVGLQAARVRMGRVGQLPLGMSAADAS